MVAKIKINYVKFLSISQLNNLPFLTVIHTEIHSLQQLKIFLFCSSRLIETKVGFIKG